MIRKMQVEDIDDVIQIDAVSFPVPWNKEQYLYELEDNEFAQLYVLEENHKIIGYVDFWITFEICQLAKIAVDPNYRGHKKAHELMDLMIEEATSKECETISLEVRVSNQAAHKLYEAYDFIKVNVRKNYYQDNGEDADLLVKAIGGF